MDLTKSGQSDLRDLGADGRVRVILTRNIGKRAFDDINLYERFLNRRGTSEFAKAILTMDLPTNGWFERRRKTEEIDAGYDLGVLNSIMITDEFMPVYEWTSKKAGTFKAFREVVQGALKNAGLTKYIGRLITKLQEVWNAWTIEGGALTLKRSMFSRYGLFQVMLDKEFGNDKSLFEIMDTVQTLGKRLVASVPGLDDALKDALLNNTKLSSDDKTILRGLRYYSFQWEIVREMLYITVNEINNAVRTNLIPGSSHVDLLAAINECADAHDAPHTFYNSRSRYVIYEVYQFKDTVRGNPIPRHETTEPMVHNAITGLLESAPIEQENRQYLADAKASRQQELLADDVASWPYEHCIFTHDNAVFYHEKGTSDRGAELFKFRGYNYNEYWASIMRTTRYFAELRLSAKVIEYYTAKDLETLAGNIADPKKVAIVAKSVANWARILARLRYMSLPTTVGSSDFAIMKYEQLRSVLGITEIIANANANINLILALLPNRIISTSQEIY